MVGSRVASGPQGVNGYQFIDDLSTVSGDVFYYRLNEIDFDGKEKYSRTILLRRNNLPRPIVYPNPAGSNLNLIISSKSQQLISIDIFRCNGKGCIKTKRKGF
jgi:hypothetical protein